MCGIAGLWARDGGSADALALAASAMTAALAHRGPDDSGIWADAEAGIVLGHRRLSIIDLTSMGHQPMTSSDERYTITYNGEIYNFGDLRDELAAGGAQFRGHSDTEVIVEGCVRWGVEPTIRRLNGMFAIALWDAKERRLYFARDRMGEKPLYWAVFGPLVLFGSELKALRAHTGWQPKLNRGAIAAFLRHNYVPGPFTIYEDVYKLPPAGLVSIASTGEPEQRSYWQLDSVVERGRREPLSANEDELVEALDALLQDAVSRRMIAEVPLGAFLSGGYDSSTVVALMQKTSSRPVKTFTISFENAAFDESSHAEAVARHLGTEHTSFLVTGAEALAGIPRLPEMYDEPFADSSQVPTHIVSALTRQHVTVALSGDGGDELFSGYNRYQWAETMWRSGAAVPPAVRRLASSAIRAVPLAWYDRLSRALPYLRHVPQVGYKAHRYAQTLAMVSIDEVYHRLVSHHERPGDIAKHAEEVRTGCWNEDNERLLPDPIDRMRYLDMRTYLPDDILTKVDRASMAVALEVRVPFLDHRVVEWVWRLPAEQNARAARPKHLLRRVLSRYVPSGLVDRPKMGFGVPLADWLRGPLRDWAEDLMTERTLDNDGIFHVPQVRRLWTTFLGGDDRQHYFVWNVLMFQAWHRRWRTAAA